MSASALDGGLITLEQMKLAIMNYYASADNWRETATMLQNLSASETYAAFSELPNVTNLTPVLSETGEVVGSVYNLSASTLAPAELGPISAAAEINSNVIASEARVATLAIPQNAAINASTGALEVTSGATKVATGTSVMTTLGNVAAGIAAAGIGMNLGVWIDGALYNANPDFWNSHNMSELNPETWKSTAIGNFLVKGSKYDSFISMMDETGQTYIDENLYAMVAQYLASQGAYSVEREGRITPSMQSLLQYPNFNYPDIGYSQGHIFARTYNSYAPGGQYINEVWGDNSTEPVYGYWFKFGNSDSDWYAVLFSKSPFTAHLKRLHTGQTDNYNVNTPTHPGTGSTGVTWYEWSIGAGFRDIVAGVGNNLHSDYRHCSTHDCNYIALYGEQIITPGVEGINPYGQVPEGITDTMTPQQVIDLLRQQYPNIFDNEIKQGVLQPDGTIKEKYYLPYTIPSGGTDEQPTTNPNDSPTPDPANKPQAENAVKTATPPGPSKPTPNDGNGDSGTGTTPPVTVPSGSAEALYSVYNPTNAEVNAFGAWLWSPNFVNQLLKMFNDPMQAIISLHKIFLTPSISGRGNIVVGYLDSGVGSNIVSNQYTIHDCGYVDLKEVFGNIFDYAPFTKVELYLPFYGIVPLNVADIMRGTLNVIYRCDVLTGDCFIEVRVKRDGHLNTLYTFNGNCSVKYPLSSMSYMALVTSSVLAVGGTLIGAAMGGPMGAGLAIGGVGKATSNLLGGSGGANFSRSGSLSGNAGAMGGKAPYLIITRPQTSLAPNFPHLSGYPSNNTVALGSCSGFVKVKYVHIDPLTTATFNEKEEIKRMLLSGVTI